MIISLISQKGGVGKSALSRLIAVEYAKAGWAVKIGDLDTGQGSTAKWKARRDQNGIAPEIPVEKYATVDRAINDAENYDLMVLDGPAFAERRGLSMAQASDLIIMPTGYSLDDMDPQIETAYELEEQGINSEQMVFIFCRADGSASEEAAARRYIKKPVSMCLILFSLKDHLFGRLTIRAGRPVKFRTLRLDPRFCRWLKPSWTNSTRTTRNHGQSRFKYRPAST